MTFIPSEYDTQTVMVCRTCEQDEAFRTFLNEKGYKWCTGDSYLAHAAWGKYEDAVCYRFLEGEYSSYQYFEREGYRLLEFDDFDWGDLYIDNFESEAEDSGALVDFLDSLTEVYR